MTNDETMRQFRCSRCGALVKWSGCWVDKPLCWKCGWRESASELRKLDMAMVKFDHAAQIYPIYRARVDTGKTLLEAAEAVGLHPGILQGIETHQMAASRRVLRQLSRLYGITLRASTLAKGNT